MIMAASPPDGLTMLRDPGRRLLARTLDLDRLLEPIARLEGSRVVCRSQSTGHAVVVALADGALERSDTGLDLDDYLAEIRRLRATRTRGLAIARKVAEERIAAGIRIPRPTEWHALDVRSRDYILGIAVARFDPGVGHVVARVALTSGSPIHEAGEGARLQLLQLLALGASCGGSLAIRFTTDVEGGRIPRAYTALARQLDLELDPDSDTIPHPTALEFLLRMTPMSERWREALRGLAAPERGCLHVHRGLLACSELEALLAAGLPGERLIASDPSTGPLADEAAHAILRGARLARHFIQLLRRRPDTSAWLIEDDELHAEVAVVGPDSLRVSSLESDLQIPWLTSGTGVIRRGGAATVSFRVWTLPEARRLLCPDISAHRGQDGPGPVIVVLPADVEELVQSHDIIAHAASAGVCLSLAPFSWLELDREIERVLLALGDTAGGEI